MSAQSEALRLADRLEGRWALHPEMQEVAAELRRLHDENQRLRLIVPQVLEDLNDKLCEDNERLTAQRDALLEALRPFAAINASIGFTHKDVDRARAAIKAVEEGK